MNGNGAIDFTASAEEAAQRELDFGGIAVRLRHAREDLGGVVKTVVDEMVEADVVVTRQADGACSAIAAPQHPGSNAYGYESQCEQEWRQLDHAEVTAAEA